MCTEHNRRANILSTISCFFSLSLSFSLLTSQLSAHLSTEGLLTRCCLLDPGMVEVFNYDVSSTCRLYSSSAIRIFPSASPIVS